MMKFAFRDWLTFEEAAEYMTKVTGQECPVAAIEEAVYKRALTAYFYTREQLGLYMDEESHHERTRRLRAERPNFLKHYLTDKTFRAYNSTTEPIPIYDYRDFKRIIKLSGQLSYPCGLTVFAENKALLGGIYDIGEKGYPKCIGKVKHLVLISRNNLDELAKYSPREWLYFKNPLSYMMVTETKYAIFEKTQYTVSLPTHIPVIDECIEQELMQNKPTPKPADPDTEKGLIGTQRALALAVHLLVEVAEQLDNTDEYKRKGSSARYNLTTEDGKPIVSKIATYLAETAERKKLPGRGFSSPHLGKIITQALKEHGL